MEYCISSLPEGLDQRPGFALYRIVVKVEAVEDMNDAPNFLRGKEGQKISFWSRFRLDPKLFGKKVKAIVEYRGDERGGRYMLEKVEIVP